MRIDWCSSSTAPPKEHLFYGQGDFFHTFYRAGEEDNFIILFLFSLGMGERGQITVFMILGLVLLFVFLFLFKLTSLVKVEELQESREEAFNKVFNKEALRIFVEDCLQDELEEGLKLMGKQGRIWREQGGGADFVEGVTGVTRSDGARVFYGITRKAYPHDQNAYPCGSDTGGAPFCKYQYPNTSSSFGELQLTFAVLKEDLERFVEDRAKQCVGSYLAEEMSQEITPEDAELDLGLQISNDGISVDVTYPLKFSVAGKEYFHLTRFDFFYPTSFRKFVESAVTYPLQWDYQYVDFSYRNGVVPEDAHLKELDFTFGKENPLLPATIPLNCNPFDGRYLECKLRTRSPNYISFAPQLNIVDINGDDIFEFTAPTILRSREPYTYRIARQNRPPALDYIHREECITGDLNKDYDYLVVQGHEELGEIDLLAKAIDPDEDGNVIEDGITTHSKDLNYIWTLDSIKTLFDGDAIPPALLPVDQQETIPPGNLKTSHFKLDKNTVSTHFTTPNFYTIPLTSYDGYLGDAQDIKILVDRPIETDIWLESPYGNYPSKIGDNIYRVSMEDPIFLHVKIPEESEDSTADEAPLVFQYTAPGKLPIEFNTPDPSRINIRGDKCYNLPWSQNVPAECQLHQYGLIDFLGFNLFDFQPFSIVTTLDRPGKFKVAYSQNYCQTGREAGSEKEIDVVVQECLPYKDPAHPYPYMPDIPTTAVEEDKLYQKTFVTTTDAEGRKITDFDQPLNDDATLSPFLATHSCCNPDGTIKGTDSVCYRDRENLIPGCYGKVREISSPYNALFTSSYVGYIREEVVRHCDNQRGNICGGEFFNELWGDQLRCGANGEPGCVVSTGKIEEKCQGEAAFSYVDQDDDGNDDAWCQGTLGCGDLCEEVVYKGQVPLPESKYYSVGAMNSMATEIVLGGDPDVMGNPQFPVKCNCISGTDDGKPCDADYDGYFREKCDQGECLPTNACVPNSVFCDYESETIKWCNGLGTKVIRPEDCAANQYCSEAGGLAHCEPKKCDGYVFHYLEYIDHQGERGRITIEITGRFTDPNIDNEERVWLGKELQNGIWACNERGSGYRFEGICDPRISGPTFVQQEDGGWVCQQKCEANDRGKECRANGVRDGICTREGRNVYCKAAS